MCLLGHETWSRSRASGFIVDRKDRGEDRGEDLGKEKRGHALLRSFPSSQPGIARASGRHRARARRGRLTLFSGTDSGGRSCRVDEPEDVPAESREHPLGAVNLSFEDSELRARELVRMVQARSCAPGPIQERLAELVLLLEGLRLPRERALLFDEAELILKQLEHEPPNLVLADRLLTHLKARSGRPQVQRLLRLVMSAAPHVIVAAGAIMAMVISFVLTHVIIPLTPRTDLLTLQLVTEAGFVGALTSLMLRFHAIRARWQLSTRDAFFEGFFRPFIGVFFAWMIYYLLDAELFPFRPAAGASKTQLYIGLAFVTGFSERLAASVVEGLVAQASGDRDAGGGSKR